MTTTDLEGIIGKDHVVTILFATAVPCWRVRRTRKKLASMPDRGEIQATGATLEEALILIRDTLDFMQRHPLRKSRGGRPAELKPATRE